ALIAVRIARIRNPNRIGEMVQRDEGADAVGDELVDELSVVLEGALVDFASFRLDSRPLDAEAVRVEVKLLHQRDVLDGARVAERSIAHEGALAHAFGLRPRPQVPIGMGILVFDLRGGARRTEAERSLARRRSDGTNRLKGDVLRFRRG